MSPDSPPHSVLDLTAMKAAGRKIVMLTCYDATFARLIAPEVDVLLVGDSVSQVVAGHKTTLSATLEQLMYHARAVRRGAPDSLLLVDLPFLSYQVSVEEAIRNAGQVLKKTGAQGVKLEGGRQMVATVRKNGSPVWYLMAKDEGHGFAKKKNQDYQLYATVRFLQDHLLK